jgi:hypothetical protein
MKELIVFEKEEFEKKLIEFCDNFINYSNKDFGVSLISNDSKEILKDRETIAGSFMLPWHDTFSKDNK